MSGAGTGGQQATRIALLLMSMALGVGFGGEAAWAQRQDTVQVAQIEERRRFDVPPQPMADALTAFGQQSGLQVSVDGALVRGVTSPGVSGVMTAERALTRLLAGTGFSHSITGANTINLQRTRRAGDDGALTLDPITVEGQSEAAFGPVERYVATRSAAATKTDTALLKVPQSVSVVTSDQAEAQGSRTINEALRYTPGVVTETRGVATRYDGVQIRGFGGYIGADQSTYLDGLRLLRNNEYSYTSVDPYTLERIELFRGPGSVLYGQSSPGGLTSLISKKPTDEPQHEIELEAGSHDSFQGAFDLGGPLDGDGRLLYRVVGLARDADSQIDFVEERRYLLAPSLTWRATEATSVTLLTSYQRDPEGGFFGWVPASGTILPNPNGKLPSSFFDGDPSFEEFDRTQAMAGYSLEHRFDNGWMFRQNARYMHLDLDYRQVYSAGFQADSRTLNRGTALSDERTASISVDNQVHARFATGPLAHQILVGLDYYRLDSDVRSGFGAAPTLDAFDPDYTQTIPEPDIGFDLDESLDQLGVYLQDQIELGRLTVSLGGRYDWADSRTENRLTGTTSEQDDTAFTGKVGVVYEFEAGIAPYASYSESFLPVSGSDVAGQPFEPETGEQYEVGVKYQPPGGTSFAAVSAFHLTRQNVTTGDPNNVGFSVQTGEIRSRGIEAEAKLSLFPGFALISSYTYLDAEITRNNDGNEGNRPASVPEHTLSVWADYQVPQGSLRGLGVAAGVRYVGEAFGDNTNTFEVPDYTVVDAALRYDLGALTAQLDGVDVRLNVRNLFDERYISSCEVSSSFCYFGARRTVLATLRYRW